jgi:hypothetical protein
MKLWLLKAPVILAVIFVVMLAAATLSGAAVLTTFLPSVPGPGIPVWRTARTRSVQAALLTEIRDVLRFNTVEYVYRTVFPQDFMAPGLSLRGITNQLRTGTGRFEEILSQEEREYLRAYDISSHLGLRTGDDGGEFLVVTVIVRAGFDLHAEEFSSAESLELERRPDGTVAVIRLPRPVVTDVVVEDIDPSSYRFPDVPVSPEGWREIVRGRVVQRTVEAGILEYAEANAESFIRRLLPAAGINALEFVTR